MSPLAASIRLDMRLQSRTRLYAIGIFVAILMGLLGRYLVTDEYAGRILVLFYFGGLGGTTYMFAAAMVLLEKSDGTLQALRTTPLQTTTYLFSKVLTLTGFAALESAIVYAIGFYGSGVHPVPLFIGIVTLGTLYTLLGMGQVASHDSVTSFLFPGAAAVSLALQLPLLYLLMPQLAPVWLHPTHGSLLLFLGASESMSAWHWAFAVGTPWLWIALAYRWTLKRFADHIGLQEKP